MPNSHQQIISITSQHKDIKLKLNHMNLFESTGYPIQQLQKMHSFPYLLALYSKQINLQTLKLVFAN